MKPATKPQIVHESEAQRQHVRLPFPADVEINGQNFKAQDLSSGGVRIGNIGGIFTAGKKIPAMLKFSLSGIDFSINTQAEIMHYDLNKKSLGCRFTNMEANQIAALNHILKAYMAGDIVAANDILQISTRDNFVKARNVQSHTTRSNFTKRVLGIGIMMILGLAASAMIAGNIYDKLFIVKALDAAVVADDESYNTAPVIVAQLEPQQASRINIKAPARISIAGAYGQYTGHVMDIKSGMQRGEALPLTNTGYAAHPVEIKIVTDRPVPPDMLGRPARVTFDLR